MSFILVIDDDPLTADFVRLLGDDDWTVWHAADGVTGLALLRKTPEIELIVLDINLPGFDGYRTATQIRAFTKHVRIVPHTVIDPIHDPHLAAFMSELGAAPVVQKGFPPEVLYQRIREALATSPVVPQSPLLIQLQREVSAREREIRLQQATYCLMIYVQAMISQIGLRAILEQITNDAPIHVLTTLDQVTQDMYHQGICILVITTREFHLIRHLVSSYPRTYALVVVRSVDEAYAITPYTDEQSASKWTILLDDQNLDTKLAQVIHAIRTGDRYSDPALVTAQTDYTQLLQHIVHERFNVTISAAELQILHMQIQNLDTRTMAQRLGTSKSNIYQMRSRLAKRVGVANITDLVHALMLQLEQL